MIELHKGELEIKDPEEETKCQIDNEVQITVAK